MGQLYPKRYGIPTVAMFIALFGVLLISTIIEAATSGNQMIRRRHLNHQSILPEHDGDEHRERSTGEHIIISFSFYSFIRLHCLYCRSRVVFRFCTLCSCISL